MASNSRKRPLSGLSPPLYPPIIPPSPKRGKISRSTLFSLTRALGCCERGSGAEVIGWEGAIVEGVRAGGDAGLILAAGAMGRIEGLDAKIKAKKKSGVPLGGIISALVYRARVDSRVFLQVITAVRDISETRATEIT
eukprot:1349522-Amorphochlora_amoeboformis.AAC.1